MMGRKTVRNMWSRNTNKIGIQCVCWFYSQGIVTMHGHTILKLKIGSLFFCGSCKLWCVMPLKEFLVTTVKVTVQAPKDTVLKFALLVCNWKDLVSSLLPHTWYISVFISYNRNSTAPWNRLHVILEYSCKSVVVIISRVTAGDGLLWKVPRDRHYLT